MKILTECIEEIDDNGIFTTIVLKSGDVIHTSPCDGHHSVITFTTIETIGGELRPAISINQQKLK